MDSTGTIHPNMMGTTLLAHQNYYIKIKPIGFNINNSNFSLTVKKLKIQMTHYLMSNGHY